MIWRYQETVLQPSVSVIIPVYNRSQLVRRAIQSVLNQSYENFELIIVDDGSTDDLVISLSDIDDSRLRLISHEMRKGAAAARNTGILQASAQYIAFLDSDDYWLPRKLERQLNFMRLSYGKARLSCTAYEIRYPNSSGGEFRFTKPLVGEMDICSGCFLSPGATLLAERSLILEVGLMNEALRRLEDWDWLLRAVKISNLMVLNEVLTVVDVSSAEKIDYNEVKAAADLMRTLHFRSGNLHLIRRWKFLAALEYEISAAAYRNKRNALALCHLLRSLFCYPFRGPESFRRLLFRVLSASHGGR